MEPLNDNEPVGEEISAEDAEALARAASAGGLGLARVPLPLQGGSLHRARHARRRGNNKAPLTPRGAAETGFTP